MMKYVELGSNVYASFYSYWNPLYHSRIKELSTIVKQSLNILSEVMVFPEDQPVILRCLNCYGEFRFIGQTIHIDHRRNDFKFIETLCHELVHSEQYFTRKLQFFFQDNESQIEYDGVLFHVGEVDISKGYQPWEKEAYSRQHSLAQYVVDRLKGY